MTPDEVRALIARDEDAQVEFKLENEPQPSLAGVIAAMANASGGWILVGVDDTGEIKGVSRTKPIIDRFHSAAASIEPSLAGRVEVETVQLARIHACRRTCSNKSHFGLFCWRGLPHSDWIIQQTLNP